MVLGAGSFTWGAAPGCDPCPLWPSHPFGTGSVEIYVEDPESNHSLIGMKTVNNSIQQLMRNPLPTPINIATFIVFTNSTLDGK